MQLIFEQIIKVPREVVFAFHENPENLLLIHAGWATVRLIKHDGGLTPNNRLWIEITVLKILPMVMGFEHTIYDPPKCFTERLVHGVFDTFNHRHEFEETSGGTLVRDVLEVKLPWLYGGELVMHTIAGPMLKQMFKHRQQSLLKLALSGVLESHGASPSWKK